MNTSGSRRFGWRIAIAFAAVVALTTTGLLAQSAAADTPLPRLALSSSPTETGSPVVGQTLGAVGGTWTPAAESVDYQWTRDQLPIAGAVSSQYTLTDADQAQEIAVTMTAHRSGYQPSVINSPFPDVTGPNTIGSFSIDTPASATGTAQVGQPIVVSPGTFEPSDAIVAYRWKVGGTIHIQSGAGANTYTPTPADDNNPIGVVVIRIAALFHPSFQVLDLGDVIPVTLSNQAVNIIGVPTVGNALTALTGWDPERAHEDFQWTRDGANIDGATSRVYTLVADDAGHTVAVQVTGSYPGLGSETATAATASPVAAQFSQIPVPVISGTPVIGSVLSADGGAWAPSAVALTYEWFAGSTPVQYGDSNTFLPTSAAVLGKNITVQVTATAPGFGPSTSSVSAPTSAIAPEPISISSLKISAAHLNAPITVSYSLSNGLVGVPLTYTWQRNEVTIAGASGSTYTPQPGDFGQRLSATVSSGDPRYVAPPTGSNAVVVGSGFLTAATPQFSAAVRVGADLHAVTGTWGPGPVAFTYQWMIPWAPPNVGPERVLSTASHYTVPASLLGKRLQLWVSGTEAHFVNSHDLWYASSVVIVAPGLLTVRTAPSIAGLPSVGSRLTASRGTLSPTSGVTYRYQWFSATSATSTAVAIPHATAGTYVPIAGLAGHLISVRVTASKTAYSTESTFSAPTRALLPRITVRPNSSAPIAHTLR